MKVLVLGGGDSPEREVSLRSAKSVADAARTAGFDVEEYDPANGMEFLNALAKDTIVLPILHGVNGEDGIIQAVLEENGLPFLGADSASSAVCFDKWLTLQTFKAHGLPTPVSQFIRKEDFEKSELIKRPYVLKVAHGGSSIGVLVARDQSKVKQEEIDEVFKMESGAVLEELVEGIEITVPVLDDTALPVIEIVPPANGEFDYDNKYNGSTQEIVPPKNVPADIQRKAQEIAQKAHLVMKCRHLSRTDIMIGANSNLFALEINTMPGMTGQSLFPKAAKVAGMDMPALVTKFVEMVKRDYKL